MPTHRPGPRGAGPRGGGPGGQRPGARGSRSRGAATSRAAGAARASGAPRGSGADEARPAVRGAEAGARPAAPRPRFTGRAAVLVVVLAVLTVSYASSLRAYIQQRTHITDLKAKIAEREASINALEREKQRWDDPAYVKTQARERFGYLMPGETGFEVIGPDGKPLEPQATLRDPAEVLKVAPTAWWTTAWDSVELAGNPPAPAEEPADLVDGTKSDGGAGAQGGDPR